MSTSIMYVARRFRTTRGITRPLAQWNSGVADIRFRTLPTSVEERDWNDNNKDETLARGRSRSARFLFSASCQEQLTLTIKIDLRRKKSPHSRSVVLLQPNIYRTCICGEKLSSGSKKKTLIHDARVEQRVKQHEIKWCALFRCYFNSRVVRSRKNFRAYLFRRVIALVRAQIRSGIFAGSFL